MTRFPGSVFGILFALVLLPALAGAAPLKIVTSIKPITLMVRAIAPESALVTTLIPAGASPHTYQLRPSDRQALADADLVFWVGPDMELFLDRILSSPELAPKSHQLMSETVITDAGQHEHHDDAEHDSHADEDGHHHSGIDPHIWLDPQAALGMTQIIEQALIQTADDTPGSDVDGLSQRLKQFEAQLKEKETAIRKQLAQLNAIDIFTYHDAFRRFAEHYDITIAGALTITPEQTPGAKHMQDIQNKLRAAHTPCLMTEPQFNRDWWQSLSEGVDITIVTWDPLASNIADSRSGYVDFQQSLADAALKCLPQ
ncbi:zinc ABC transporter substrate-binding protein [Marinobacter sp. 1Y8]